MRRLQDEDSTDYGEPITPESAVADAIRSRTEAILKQVRTFWQCIGCTIKAFAMTAWQIHSRYITSRLRSAASRKQRPVLTGLLLSAANRQAAQ